MGVTWPVHERWEKLLPPPPTTRQGTPPVIA